MGEEIGDGQTGTGTKIIDVGVGHVARLARHAQSAYYGK